MATKMTEKEEIEKLKNRIKELEEKAKRKQVNSALQFFKKNKIVDLLGSPEKLKEFTTEVMPIIKKYQPIEDKKDTAVKEGNNEEWERNYWK